MRKVSTFFGGLLLAIGVMASSAQAGLVTIDFSGHGVGGAIGNTYAPLGATFTSGTFAQCNAGCPAPTPNGYFDLAPSTVFFTSLQSAVSFQVVSYSIITATAYNSSNVAVASLTDTQTLPPTGVIDTLSGAGIESVVFAPGPQGGVTNLTFDSSVPELSTWAMMLAGFAGLGFVGYRRTRASAMAA